LEAPVTIATLLLSFLAMCISLISYLSVPNIASGVRRQGGFFNDWYVKMREAAQGYKNVAKAKSYCKQDS
jgi:hypothetical protein